MINNYIKTTGQYLFFSFVVKLFSIIHVTTTNQPLYLVNEIHQAFEKPNSIEMCAVFLGISEAFDKVWHDGLVFKLKQNGVWVV